MITSNRSEPSQRKMKLLFVLLAVLGVSTAAVLPAGEALDRNTRSLSDDWADFSILIPTDAILSIVTNYLSTDEEVQTAAEWMRSSECLEMASALMSHQSVINFGGYLRDAGVDVDSYVTAVKAWLGLSRSASTVVSTRTTGGVAGMISEIKAILPLAELRALFLEKRETSESFAALVAYCTSDKAIAFVTEIRATVQYQSLLAKCEGYGLDFENIRDLIKALLGWE